jgi:membrane protein YdbS with pleckstrin-like domain
MNLINYWNDTTKDNIQKKIIQNKKIIILIISIIILIIGIVLLLVYLDESSTKLYFINGFSFLFLIVGSINIINLIIK